MTERKAPPGFREEPLSYVTQWIPARFALVGEALYSEFSSRAWHCGERFVAADAANHISGISRCVMAQR